MPALARAVALWCIEEVLLAPVEAAEEDLLHLCSLGNLMDLGYGWLNVVQSVQELLVLFIDVALLLNSHTDVE